MTSSLLAVVLIAQALIPAATQPSQPNTTTAAICGYYSGATESQVCEWGYADSTTASGVTTGDSALLFTQGMSGTGALDIGQYGGSVQVRIDGTSTTVMGTEIVGGAGIVGGDEWVDGGLYVDAGIWDTGSEFVQGTLHVDGGVYTDAGVWIRGEIYLDGGMQVIGSANIDMSSSSGQTLTSTGAFQSNASTNGFSHIVNGTTSNWNGDGTVPTMSVSDGDPSFSSTSLYVESQGTGVAIQASSDQGSDVLDAITSGAGTAVYGQGGYCGVHGSVSGSTGVAGVLGEFLYKGVGATGYGVEGQTSTANNSAAVYANATGAGATYGLLANASGTNAAVYGNNTGAGPGGQFSSIKMIAGSGNIDLRDSSGTLYAPTGGSVFASAIGTSGGVAWSGGSFTATSGAGSFNLSSSVSTFSTPSGAGTFNGSSNTFSHGVVFSGGSTASGSTAFDLSGSSGAENTTTGLYTSLASSNVFNNKIAVGGGQFILGYFSATTSSLTPGSVLPGTPVISSQTVTGASAGDVCSVGSPSTGPGTNILVSCYCTTTNACSLKWIVSGTLTETATSGVYKILATHL